MKKLNFNHILFCIFVFISGFSFGQEINVLDNATLQPVAGAYVYVNEVLQGSTDNKGKITLNGLKKGDQITIKHLSFFPATVTFEDLEKNNFKIFLNEKVYNLEAFVISPKRDSLTLKESPLKIRKIEAEEINFYNPQTTADMLIYTGDVFVQKSQQGGGSPVLRGFEASRVLLVIDGIRMNNAIYRSGHLQNIITIDPNMIQSAEVIFGPGSVIYGSDALGGVMVFQTKNPVFSNDSKWITKGSAYTRYSTANEEKTGHFDISIANNKFGWISSYTYSGFGDLMQGNNRNYALGTNWYRNFYVKTIDGKDSVFVNKNPNLQVGSGYEQFDILQKIMWKQSANITHTFNFQYSTSSNIPRYDRLQQTSGGLPRFAEWYYGPQKRLLTYYKLEHTQGKWWDKATLTTSFQNIEESRHTRRLNNLKLQSRIENVEVYALNADFSKKIKKHKIFYGLEGVYNKVWSKAHTTNIITGETDSLDTRYPDGGSDWYSAAIYLNYSYKFNDLLTLHAGSRYNYIELFSLFKSKNFFPFPFDEVRQVNHAPGGMIGITYLPGKWKIALTGNTGFRSPNVDDLGKVFESVPGLLIVPNPNIKPEYTYTADLTIGREIEKTYLEATAYYTYYDNLITTAPYTFNGQDSIFYDGRWSRIVANQNALNAFIYGLQASMQANVTEYFSIRSTLTYTYGRIKTDSTPYPLDHIPPVYGMTSFKLNKNKFKGEIFFIYNGWKRLKDYNMFGEDNLSTATPWGMPAWITVNARTGYHLNKFLEIQLALENILDQNYRHFASGISAPGRNFRITIRGYF